MKIEKVTRYVADSSPSRSSSNSFSRRIPLSLPRVKWLECDPDYKPPASDEEPDIEDEFKVDRRKDNRIGGRAKTGGFRGFRPEMRSDKLSPAQQQAWDLYNSGMTLVAIGVEMNRSTNAVSKLLGQAREKLGIGLK